MVTLVSRFLFFLKIRLEREREREKRGRNRFQGKGSHRSVTAAVAPPGTKKVDAKRRQAQKK
jgi:hypothetical protein